MTRKQATIIAKEIKNADVLPALRTASLAGIREDVYGSTANLATYAFKMCLDYLQAGRLDESDKANDIYVLLMHPEYADLAEYHG